MGDLFAPDSSGGMTAPPSGAGSLLEAGGGDGEILAKSVVRPTSPPPAAAGKAAAPEGRLVGGRYRLVRESGREREGISVWQGENVRTKQQVEVTLLKGDADQAAHRRAAELTDIRHPGLLRVFETGTETDPEGREVHFIAMEHGVLKPFDLMMAGGGVAPQRAVAIIAQVCDALEAIHHKKLLHGMLTPWDLLIEPPDRAVIRLFQSPHGTETDRRKTAERELAEAAYLSPEQAQGAGSGVDGTTDVYRAGAVLYWAVTGAAPYSATTVAGCREKILRGDFASPRSIRPEVEPELEEIICSAMRRVKERRTPTCAQMAARIRKHLKIESKAEPAVASRKPAPKGLRARILMHYQAHRARTIAAALVIVLLLGGGAGAWIWRLQLADGRENAFTRASADALRLHGEGRFSEALVSVDAALLIRPDGGLDALRSDCVRRSREEVVLNLVAEVGRLSRVGATTLQQLQDSLGRLEKGAAGFAEGLVPEGTDPRPWSVYGETQLVLGDFEKAEQAFERAILLGSRDAGTGVLMARACLARALMANHVVRLMIGRTETDPRSEDWIARARDAIRRPTQPLRKGRDAQVAELYLAACKGERAEVGRLADELSRPGALQAAPDLDEVAFVKAAWGGGGESDDFEGALRLLPHQSLLHMMRGVRRVEGRRHEEGIRDLSRAAALAPKSAVLLLLRAKARVVGGQPEGAAADLGAAEALAPRGWEYGVYVAQIRRTLPERFQAPPASSK